MDHRRERRTHVVMTARLRWASGDSAVKLKNLSSRGACVTCPQELAPDDHVQLIRGDLVIPATVIWAADGRIGMAFLDRLDEQAFLAQGHSAGSGAAVIAPQHQPVERLSRRLEQHWTGILKD